MGAIPATAALPATTVPGTRSLPPAVRAEAGVEGGWILCND